jgi:hypothetical protein
MKYRIMERTDAPGEPTEVPLEYVAIDVPAGIVLERTFVARTMPAARHSGGATRRGRQFPQRGKRNLGLRNRRRAQDEFRPAVKNSQVAMECVPLDDDDRLSAA